MNYNARLSKLEKRAGEQPYGRPQVVEIYGTREDGTRYLIEAWGALIGAETITDREGSPINEQP